MIRKLAVAALVAAAAPLAGAGLCAPPGGDLAAEVSAIVRADYRGDRAGLARHGTSVAALPTEEAKYREYWAGFAWWRRGINGFNETPRPDDLVADFERCAAHERAALALDPGFEDASSALMGCLGGQLFLAKTLSEEKRAALVAEGTAVLKGLKERNVENARSLWILGGYQAFPPPPRQGDVERAAATFRRGLAAARAEALGGPRAPWVPAWGAPENLMSLAYLYTHGPAPNKALALAYADAALALVPDWHFVADVLRPQIEKLDAAPR